MLEAALNLSVVLAFIMGIVYFGLAIWSYGLVAHAARSATRYAIVHGAANAQPATATSITSVVKAQAVGLDPNKLTVAVSWIPNNRPGSDVKVVVGYNFQLTLPFVPRKNLALTSTSQLMIVD